MFTGSSALAMDAKGRLSMPTRHREALMTQCAGRLTLAKNPAGCLVLMPEPVWEQMLEQLVDMGGEAANWRRFLLGSAQEVVMDSAGRVLIAPELRAFAKLQRDLMLLGVGRHFELWDAGAHAQDEAGTMASPLPDALKSFRI